MFAEDASNDASFYSQDGSMTSTQKKKKKGLKKLGSTIRFAFGGGGTKRRRNKKGGTDSLSEEGSSNSGSQPNGRKSGGDSSGFVRPDGSPNTVAQQEWIGNTGGNGLAEMAAIGDGRVNSVGGRGKSLTKITEEEHEDSTGDYMGDAAAFRRNSSSERGLRRGVRPNKSALSPSNGSVSENGSVSSKGSRFGWRSKNSDPQPAADPLTLVVLVVDPQSLRFELLSLDFDLTVFKSGKKKKKRKNLSENHSDQLTVQDVLDQIGPSALTDEKLRERVKKPGACKGLIDRKGQIHFGVASLERACACRPLRKVDEALQKQQQNNNGTVNKRGMGLLSVPTYGGEPHRDVLLGFFGEDSVDMDGSSISQETMAAVAESLELARPIFADPNVINLMEQSGYDLAGWKTSPISGKSGSRSVESTKLGKPVVPSTGARKNKRGMSSLKRTVLGLLALILATVLAWSVVAGGLRLLPDDAGSPKSDGDGPITLEGFLMHGYQLAKAWYYSDEGAAVALADASSRKKAF